MLTDKLKNVKNLRITEIAKHAIDNDKKNLAVMLL